MATSAVRVAANGPEFVERVRRGTGLSLQVLSGEREAYYGTLGALNEVEIERGFVVDIGGGSAQVSQVQNHRFQRGQALTLGALALTDRFVRSDPITTAEFRAVQREINRQLDTVPWCTSTGDSALVCVGGSVRNLARMDAARREYPLHTMHGYRLDRSSVQESLALLRATPLAKRRRLAGLNSDRADIILPAALVVLNIMDRLQVDHLTVSLSGLREGIFFEQFWQHLAYPVVPAVRRFGVLNLARNHGYLKGHANHVRYLCGRLFEQLAPLHGYGAAERELLDAAALLHDIGGIIGYDDHHRHSQTLIEYNGLPGFSAREIALVGLLARYHRRGGPQVTGYELLLDEADQVRLLRLAAILRLAEFLERGRNGVVNDVSVAWDDNSLSLCLIADEYPAVEMWQAERHALPLLEIAFGRAARVDSILAPDTQPGAGCEGSTVDTPAHQDAAGDLLPI
jgi:exopolyphosphatase/guanosine-5'-triphosphate,3'-diphosphate pyrophosphatase